MDDNTAVIRLCAEGDKEAMEFLYRTYCPKMVRVIRRYVDDDAAAEDILHDGFIVIFSRISDVRSSDRLEFWMGTIMKNLSLQYLARTDITSLLDDNMDMPDVPELDELLSLDELMSLVNRLPDGYRNVFKLAVLENKSHKEIGRILGIAPHSSSSQLSHAKAMLRAMVVERKKELGLLSLMVMLLGGGLLYRGLLFDGRERNATAPGNGQVYAVAEHARVSADKKRPVDNSGPATANDNGRERLRTVSDNRAETSESPIIAVVDDRPDAGTVAVSDSLVSAPVPGNRTGGEFQVEIDGYPDWKPDSDPCPTPLLARNDDGWSVAPYVGLSGSSISLSGDDDSLSAGLSPENPPGSNNDPNSPVTWLPPTVHHRMPLTFGVLVQKKLSGRIGVETGITYSLLRSEMNLNDGGPSYDFRNHYIGIPLSVRLELFRNSSWTLYGLAGGKLDIPVASEIRSRSPYISPEIRSLSPGVQFSAEAGVGLQYSITRNIGIYAQPSLRYNFPNNSSMPTFWQDNRLTFSIPVGIRFSW